MSATSDTAALRLRQDLGCPGPWRTSSQKAKPLSVAVRIAILKLGGLADGPELFDDLRAVKP